MKAVLSQNATQARTNVKCADRRRRNGSLSDSLMIRRVEMNSFVKIYLCLKSPTSMYRTTSTRMFLLVPCVGVHRPRFRVAANSLLIRTQLSHRRTIMQLKWGALSHHLRVQVNVCMVIAFEIDQTKPYCQVRNGPHEKPRVLRTG